MYRKKIMAMAAGVILAVGAAGCGTEKGDDTTAILQKSTGHYVEIGKFIRRFRNENCHEK
ncbi:hypothetical protein [Anaerotignum lactatifermentans]|uniref:hypothetical protein n=1 Tax=Anaerotignum lactatifermentans TaxID=160404 RepID=UPI0027BAD419|nr:hypothetical protein [Anaerotignum lactatifermentans]